MNSGRAVNNLRIDSDGEHTYKRYGETFGTDQKVVCHGHPCKFMEDQEQLRSFQGCCHPNLRFHQCNIPAETNAPRDAFCFKNPILQEEHKRDYDSVKTDHFIQGHGDGCSNAVVHECPLGNIVRCMDCDSKTTHQHSPSQGSDHPDDRLDSNKESGQEEGIIRTCCLRDAPETELRICRCQAPNTNDILEQCPCECGAGFKKAEDKPKKKVRFSDDVNCFDAEPKELCRCCKASVPDTVECKPILVYEIPEPPFEGQSVSQKDFGWQGTPKKEMPPWHPNIKDRWYNLDVPSLKETTYQSDYKPPPVVIEETRPVYLAPMKQEKQITCCQPEEEYTKWKRTTVGPDHTYHSTCCTCDQDLHRVHLHECIPDCCAPQFHCHVDGHMGTGDNTFGLCEAEPSSERYWWKRTCCDDKGDSNKDRNQSATFKSDRNQQGKCDADLIHPQCPSYLTSYRHDFRHPQKIKRYETENCTACECFVKSQDHEGKDVCWRGKDRCKGQGGVFV